MGNAKFSWTPRLTKGISLDGSHYLSIDDSTLNLGTSDFCVSALLKVDADMADAVGWIASKGATNLANNSGWRFIVNKTSLCLGLWINDGDVSPITVYSTVPSISLGSWFLAEVVVDRDGQAVFYINGVPQGGGSVAAAAGSLNNSELFKIGADSAAATRLKGAIDFVRLRTGLAPAAWIAQEWEQLRYGYPRALGDWLELWEFEGTLTGEAAAARTLAWQGGGSPSYVSGYPYAAAPLVLPFEYNFEFDYAEGFIESHDRARALDGTLNVYTGAQKKSQDLSLRYFSFSQKTAIEAAGLSGNLLDFYKDADKPMTFQGYMMGSPNFTEVSYGLWNGDIELQEA